MSKLRNINVIEFNPIISVQNGIIHFGPTEFNMAGFLSRICEKVKYGIQWSWTYLWTVWFVLVIFVVYILRGPLKLSENISYGKTT